MGRLVSLRRVLIYIELAQNSFSDFARYQSVEAHARHHGLRSLLRDHVRAGCWSTGRASGLVYGSDQDTR